MVGPWPWKLAERRELAVPNVDWFPTGFLCINYMFFIVQNRPKDSKLVFFTYGYIYIIYPKHSKQTHAMVSIVSFALHVFPI
jgi:hypothetical protein